MRILLAPPAGRTVPFHDKTLTLTADSLATGWVRNHQCHHDLDPVPATQIVFGRGRVRNLRVTRSRNIARAWVEAETVQLEDIARNAVLCLASDNRILERADAPATYRLRAGPFMVRFLDGYFPMRVSLKVEYPPDLLVLEDIDPPPGLGVDVSTTPGRVHFSSLFEGVLWIDVRFRASPAGR